MSDLSLTAHSSELTSLTSWRLWWVWVDIPLTPLDLHTLYVTPSASNITPHSSHLTHDTSLTTPQIQALRHLNSDLSLTHTSHLTPMPGVSSWLTGWSLLLAGWSLFLSGWSLFLSGWLTKPHTSHLRYHTSHVAPLTSYIKLQTSHSLPTSHSTLQFSDLLPHALMTSDLPHQAPHLTPHFSDLGRRLRHRISDLTS